MKTPTGEVMQLGERKPYRKIPPADFKGHDWQPVNPLHPHTKATGDPYPVRCSRCPATNQEYKLEVGDKGLVMKALVDHDTRCLG